MTVISRDQLDEIYAFAVQLGKDAGDMLMDAARSRFGDAGQSEQAIEEKDSAVDIVTKTDEGMSNSGHRGALMIDGSSWEPSKLEVTT